MSAIGGGELTKEEAIKLKIYGLVLIGIIIIFLILKVYQIRRKTVSLKMNSVIIKIVAIISSVLMFMLTWFLSSMLIALVWSYSRKGVTIGPLTVSIAEFVASILSSLVAVNTYKASLNAKTGRFYKNKK
jgi:hypothetical protein